MKKLLYMALIVSMSASFTVSAYGAAYGVPVYGGSVGEISAQKVIYPSKWAENDVETAERAGIGYNDRSFDYKKKLTRAELAHAATNLYKAINVTREALFVDSHDMNSIGSAFSDSGMYNGSNGFSEEVYFALKYGIMNGMGEKMVNGFLMNSFNPDVLVTREQTAAVLYRVLEKTHHLDKLQTADLSNYSDNANISAYARDCFAAMTGSGIMTGKTPTTLAPKDICTYEQVLSLCARLINMTGLSGIENSSQIPALISSMILQGGSGSALKASWESVENAAGYAVYAKAPDNTVYRFLTAKTEMELSDWQNYISIDLYSVGINGSLSAGSVSISEAATHVAEIVETQEDAPQISEEQFIEGANQQQSVSPPSDGFNYRTDYPSTYGHDYNAKNIEIKSYSSTEEAMQDMKDVTVKVWRLNKDGSKTSASTTLTVHKEVADDVVAIFDEIYNGPEQFPINDAHAYSWRGAGSKSSHMQGLAIDINPEQNYFVSVNGSVLAGKHWEPETDPLSIKPEGDVVKAFNKYGWYWGGVGWDTTGKDFMHFSYTGV